MYGSEQCAFSFWWMVPIIMMILCFFMMRRRRGATTSGLGCCGRDRHQAQGKESTMDILDRRYAKGDIDKTEYEETKRTLSSPVSSIERD